MKNKGTKDRDRKCVTERQNSDIKTEVNRDEYYAVLNDQNYQKGSLSQKYKGLRKKLSIDHVG
jgi:hypothetical protein